MSKKIVVSVGFLIIFIGTAYVQYKNAIPEKKLATISRISVKQIITIDGKKTQTTIGMKDGSTALQTLIFSSHKVDVKGERENAFIIAIDGKRASAIDREFWALYVNGKQAEVGAGTYRIKNSDTIEWRIETY